jgi:hypothetical protein
MKRESEWFVLLNILEPQLTHSGIRDLFWPVVDTNHMLV